MSNPRLQCAALERAFERTTFSQTDQAELYQQGVASYFSVQNRLQPTCFIAPSTPKEVSEIVGILSKNSCQFAIKSGGHGPPVGSSNIAEGVTLDLGRMKDVRLSADKTTAAVQAGAKWVDVYGALDQLGYAIPGGRAGNVGVGGLTLGGGNSFFTARSGFVCDSVKNFEVVLGNGTIVQANNKTNPDLFTALKGSSNNLGIVTTFDFVAFPQGNLWGGVAAYNATKPLEHLKAFVQFTDNLAKRPFGSLILLWSYAKATGLSFTNLYEYTGDVTGKGFSSSNFPSPEFDGFAPSSPIGPPVFSTLREANLTSLTGELNAPPELSNIFASITFTNKLTVLTRVGEIINEEFDKYKDQDFFVYLSFQFQPLPRLFTDEGLKRGPNVLGVDRYTDNNVFLLVNHAWSGAQYDAKIREVTVEVIGRLQGYLKSVNALKEFQYLNYAYQDQDPIGSYGPANVQKIKDASTKYDPLQVFQKLVPGGFKLADAGKKPLLPGNAANV
ncbi:MAG: hypothetical protein Q9208_006654 [Pyrenodesmia sp. 3 TL-2023]